MTNFIKNTPLFSFIILSLCLLTMNSANASQTIVLDTFPEFHDSGITFSDSNDEEEEEEIFMIVEQSPRFPGCEDMEGNKSEKEACAQKRMLEYIYGNLIYPAEAIEKGIEGQVVIQFVVEKNGAISNINLVRNLEGGCGKEALKVIEEMNNLPERWTPGKQRGRAVRVKYTQPIKFKLEDELVVEEEPEYIEVKEKKREDKNQEEIFMIVEDTPRFPGCEDMEGSKKEKEECSQKKMLEYIYGNLKYPAEARSKGIEGQVIIQFVVEKDGSISDITLLRDLEGGCGEAALRVVEEMNNLPEKWTPGKQRGRAVRVKYTLPVKFKLAGNPKRKKN